MNIFDNLKIIGQIYCKEFILYYFLLFVLINSTLLINDVNAHDVYVCKNESDADIKVYISEYKSQSDLVVYECSNSSCANNNDGRWYFVNYESNADINIYFVNYSSEADIIVYFTKNYNDAGWRNPKKENTF